jgi:aspartate kinase
MKLWKALIHGITHTHSEAKITLTQVTSQPGVTAEIFGALADAGVTVDMIIHNNLESRDLSPLAFTIARMDLPQAQATLQKLKTSLDW